jgi:hypothetical protein
MTRAEWIQRALLASIAQRALDGAEVVQAVVLLADALEKSGAAPWDDGPNICGGSEHCPGCVGCIPALRCSPSAGTSEWSTLSNPPTNLTVDAAVKAEREACAQIADTYGDPTIARHIRAR